MTAETSPALSDLIGSRICHDLISPLGAISNGLELLEMSGLARTAPEIEMIADSVENANARVRFFRIAFGAAQPGQHSGQTETARILSDLSRTGRISMRWNVVGECERQAAKLGFLLIMCLETAMPRGGEIIVSQMGGDWSVQGQGDVIKVDPDLWQALSDPRRAAGIIPAQVQFLLAPQAAAAMGRRLVVESGDAIIRVRF